MRSKFPSKIVAAALIPLLGLSLAPTAVHATDIVIKNVDKDTGVITNNLVSGQQLRIPMNIAQGAELTAEGNVVASCQGNTGQVCLQLESGGGTGDSPPSLVITGPYSTQQQPIEVGASPKIVWTTNAAQCYGIRSNPTVASWNSIASPRSSGSFSTSSLPRDPTNVKSYALTLGCFSAAINGNADLTASYTQKTHTIYMAPSQEGGAPDPEPSPNCDVYKTTSYGGTMPTAGRGFQDTDLTEHLQAYDTLFSTSFLQTLTQGSQSLGFPPNHTSGIRDYMAVAITIPNDPSVHDKTVKFTWNTPQTPGYTGANTYYTISPCPGDFRQASATSSDPWLSYACRGGPIIAGNLTTITSNASGGYSSGSCRLPAGTTMYLNVATYNFADFWNGAPAATITDYCPPTKLCSNKVQVTRAN